MSETKKRVMIAGLLVLCLLKLLMGHELGLSELVAISGAWCCSVWLWNNNWALRLRFPQRLSSTERPASITPESKLKFIGPFDLSYKVSGALDTQEKCEQAIRTSVAEFDALFPGRRVNEPLKLDYKPETGSASATIRFSVQLRYAGPQDSKEVDTAFFECLGKQGFPQ